MDNLKNRDYVLLLDKSASMGEKDTPTGQSRWESAKESAIGIARKITEYDPDGITVIPFNAGFKAYENTTEGKVKDIFAENEPGGGTMLAPVLRHVFQDYQSRKKAGKTKPNGEILLVVTDGQPQDESEVAKEIVKFGNTLDNADAEYGISFIQVGKDQAATNFLKRLDDDLVKQGAKYDIVDTKTMDQVDTLGLTETLIAALND